MNPIMRELLGAVVWVVLSGVGLSLMVTWPLRSLSRLRGDLRRYAASFAIAGAAGHAISMGVESVLAIHICHFLTLGFAVMGGAVGVGWGRWSVDWIPARLLAIATMGILLLPIFLGVA